MNKKVLLLFLPLMVLLGGNCVNMKQADQQVTQPEHDHVLSGAAVISIDGNLLTASGVYESETETGDRKPCVKIRVNKNPRVKVFTGDTLTLSPTLQLHIVGFDVPQSKNETGKVYLKKVE